MGLSVIVTSYESPETLRRCLESLSAQPEAEEILVADCSAVDPARELEPLFPRAHFLHFGKPRSVAALRWAAYFQTRGETVAAIEARCVPSETWCGELLRAHREFPETPAIGGPVAIARPATAFDLGLYFCEYASFAPPLPEGEAGKISGANLSYKRAALEDARDLLEAGASETLLHDRWLRQGRRLRLAAAAVTFVNSLSPAEAIRQQFHYGRGYAADRARGEGAPRRLLRAVAAAALPVVLLARQSRAAIRAGRGGDLLRALLWTALLDLAWSAGELTGYLRGAGAGPPIF